MTRFPARLRWGLPGAAVVVAGAVLVGTVLASAAAPALPRRTPAQLLAAMARAKVPAAMSATVSETANLGLPSLPNIGGIASSPLSAASMLTGTHTAQIWYAGPRHLRIALPVSFGETDLRINGTQVWLWNSQGQRATRLVVQAPRRFAAPGNPGGSYHPARPEPAPLTPLEAARKLLALVGPTTRVTVGGTTVVAGRDAYQLAIAPRSSQSLVGRIVIAVDSATHLPLSVQVFARGTSSPAFSVGFTSLSFARPAMSNFTFTPPPGAKVKTVHVPAQAFVHGGMPGMPWPAGHIPGARTFGTGWLTVLAVPVGRITHIPSGGPPDIRSTPSRQVRPGGPGPVMGGPGQGLAVLGALLKAATPVHGQWGSGRLLRTSLFSVLLTSKGELLAGAVSPAVLYADAARVK
jgi:outer membrane lipoprotein-sorting protein